MTSVICLILVLSNSNYNVSHHDLVVAAITSASAVAVTLGNVGPGFGFVGPSQTYSEFSNFSKIILSALILFGRLELFTIITLIAPENWRNEK